MTELLTAPGSTRISDATAPSAAFPKSYIHWGPIIAGAIVAASAFFVLLTFAAAIGLAVVSASPTWRDTSVGLTVLSGTWIVLSAIGSFALGGYIAGRVRSSWQTSVDEIHFRDGLHGLVVWGIAVIIGVGLTWASAATVNGSAQTGRSPATNATATTPSFLAFEIDRLFRSDRRTEAGDAEARAEAGRIIGTGLGRKGLESDDRDYLVRLVSGRTGLAPADADRRVTQIVSESQDAASKARRSAVILAFTLAAAFAAAAAAAWGSSIVGGTHRDESIAPSMGFSWGRFRA